MIQSINYHLSPINYYLSTIIYHLSPIKIFTTTQKEKLLCLQFSLQLIDLMKSPVGKQEEFSVFMFFNGASGSGVGQQLKKQEISKIEFNIDGVIYDTYFYDLKDNKDQGFQHLRDWTSKKKPVVAAICGGDGTVMWVVSQLAQYGIDPNSVLLAIIPLGTGNDFSRNLGWGGKQDLLTQNSFEELRRLIRDWRVATRQYLDLWEVQIQVQSYGRFQKVQNAQDVIIPHKKMQKHFCNYFSFGIDGEIGYQFDKRRTNNRFGNMAVYGAMGVKTGLADVKTVGQLVEMMKTNNEVIFQGDSKVLKDFMPDNPFNIDMKKIGNLFEGVKGISSFHRNQNILMLNINSYMAGSTDIWKKANENDLLKPKSPPSPPSHQDGKIQMVSFSDTGALGMEKVMGKLQIGFAIKIIQSEGPFFIKFKEYPNDNEYKTFFQIDGQYVKARHPKQLIVKKSSMFPGSKIRVLHRK